MGSLTPWRVVPTAFCTLGTPVKGNYIELTLLAQLKARQAPAPVVFSDHFLMVITTFRDTVTHSHTQIRPTSRMGSQENVALKTHKEQNALRK